MRAQTIDDRGEVILIPGVLSDTECQALIAHSESVGYTAAPITTARGPVMAPQVRNNTRVMQDDPVRARWLLARLQAHLPARIKGWWLAGLNERLRWYRYDRGQRFNWHYDGAFVRSPQERSFLTVMLYLNEGFVGGETAFDLRCGMRTVTPQAGAALVFVHPLRHTGAAVTAGRKYVLRTDAMYAL